jgi:hypothetical protein
MKSTEGFRLARAIVVVSTNFDPQVVARVASGGGVFYPFPAPTDGLLATVNRAVIQAVSAMPDLETIYSLASSSRQDDSAVQFEYASILDMAAALSNISARPSELAMVQRTLEVFDEAVKKFNTIGPEARIADSDRTVVYAEIVRRVADQLSALGSSRHALAVAEDIVGNCRRILELGPLVSSSNARAGLIRRRRNEIVSRREIARDMAWAYGLPLHSEGGSE